MSRQKRYWLCQILGWGALICLSVFFAYYFNFNNESFSTPTIKRNLFAYALFCAFAGYVLSTHLLRVTLKKIKWLGFTSSKILITLFLGALVTTFVSYYSNLLLQKIPGQTFNQYRILEQKDKAIELEKDLNVANTDYYLYETPKGLDSAKYKIASKIKTETNWYRNKENKWQHSNEAGQILLSGLFNNFFLIALWVLIYAVYHYIEKNRNNQIDKLKLEAVVKSLELKTIKSHINPHFIFNALNSIRALVDENPPRARTAITELSNILRSSLQVEKQETVTLSQELDIVNDYLALEQMRFEERLKVELYIDRATLNEPVPPMMLQTLVENAIKHGISKQEAGGKIEIHALYVGNTFELNVVNTGNLLLSKNEDNKGFGIKATQDRLNLLFQNHARFEIREIENNKVESKIIMPKTF